jgi:hypothetical protein
MKKWMLFIVLAAPWARRFLVILETVTMNPAMIQDPVMGIRLIITEIICLAVIVVAVLAAINQYAEENELLETRRENRRLKAKK